MEEAVILFEKELCGEIEDIVVGGSPFFGNLQWRLTSLHIKVERSSLYFGDMWLQGYNLGCYKIIYCDIVRYMV
jgi:hypothetical protein